jgi:surface polysaccharide O-acyltransferase-like enzyme
VTGRYWFITIYVGLYLLFPFLNMAISAMNRRQHLMLNVTLVLLFSAWSSIHPSIAGMNSGGGWGLAWFVVLYCLAAWLQLYYKPSGHALRYALLWFGLSAVVAFLYCVPGERIPIAGTIAGNWYQYNSLPVCIASLSLFVCFMNVEVSNESIAGFLTKIAPATLGVYLIHAHANLSPFLWKTLDLAGHMGSRLFFVYLFLAVMGIYCVCTAVDLLRAETIGRLENTEVVRKLCTGIERRVSDYLNR